MADDRASEGREKTKPKPSPTLSGSTSRSTPRETSPYRPSKPLSEESPLLSPVGTAHEEEGLIENERMLDGHDEDDDEDDDDDNDEDFTESKNLWYMILLTISIGGLQLAWAVELSNGTPYLLSLGLSKSWMALVWIAGPLSGALVQPYVGILSDNCRSPWGKRTPFMVVGATGTVISLLGLAWAREIVGGFLGLFGADSESAGVKNSIMVFAVLFIYAVDFSINTGEKALSSSNSHH